MKRSTIILAALVVVVLSVRPAYAQFQYSVTDLGTLGGAESWATAVNSAGQVVGFADTGTAVYHAFLFTGGAMQVLGTVGGGYSMAYGINDAGQIVGTASPRVSPVYDIAFVYSGGQMQTPVGTAYVPGSSASAINNLGQVVGTWANAVPGGLQGGAFLYSGGQLQNLDISFTPAAINNVGQIVGSSGVWNELPGVHEQAWEYSGGVVNYLGAVGGLDSCANAINDSGQIVGWATATVNGSWHAFLYTNGQMQDLGTAGGVRSIANGINNAGVVVGNFNTSTYEHAFIYADGAMADLNTLIDPASGLTLISANAINDSGQIVGDATDANGNEVAFLLTPTPEPATLAMLAFGGLAMLRRRG